MTGPAYPAARAVAARVAAHFERHLARARAHGRRRLAPVASPEVVEAIIDAAFWASLRREEGYEPRISLAWVAPSHVPRPLTFARPLPLGPDALIRMAPAVERPGIHLGVWRHEGALAVWGATRTVPPYAFVLEVAAPGLLVVKDGRRLPAGKFVNVAVLEGDQVKVLDERAARLSECPAVLTSLLGFAPSGRSGESFDLVAQLAVSMRAHGRGGSLLVVPDASEEWRASIVAPVPYPIAPAFSELGDLMRVAAGERRGSWRHRLRAAVDAIAGLTAVDGATVVTDAYDLLAFGAKITRRDGAPSVERVALAEPVEGVAEQVVHPALLGGTRHQSAAQFVHDQRGALALVASQDGRFTIFAWSAGHGMVHAYRVEALLL